MPSTAHPRTFAPAYTPEKLSLPIPLLWPFYHHLSDLEAGHVCGWLQTHTAQKTGWGTQGRPLNAPQLPEEAGSRGFHKHPTWWEGCQAILPLAPESLLALPITPSWPPSLVPTHLGLLLEPPCPQPLPFQQPLQLGHADCRHELCHLLPQLLYPLGVLRLGQLQPLGGSIQLPGKRHSGYGVTAQSYRVTTRHRKLHLYLVGHPTREGCVQQSPQFLKSPFI